MPPRLCGLATSSNASTPESHETAPLVQALLTDDWQAQWPLDAEALAPVAAMFKTHSE
ncbi:hypothetical protein MJN51_40340, partial [Salmonella enterica subsp. enterica serovar Kentucky]|nr:hypothetical protein [Salmonella enterica subsp. enterica serovar Kentucky]